MSSTPYNHVRSGSMRDRPEKRSDLEPARDERSGKVREHPPTRTTISVPRSDLKLGTVNGRVTVIRRRG